MDNDIKKVIDFALERERESQEIYLDYARKTQRMGFRQLLLSMADMEKEHENKLKELKEGKGQSALFDGTQSVEARLTDFMVEEEFSLDMDYGDFLVLIIKREEKAEKLYEELKSIAVDTEVEELFSWLAEEERKHKAWAQDRYDLEILKDN
jgi:rubrerythrin